MNYFNNTTRDSVLAYQLTTEVGARIEATAKDNKITLRLISKAGAILSEQQIRVSGGGGGIQDIYVLGSDLVVILSDGSSITATGFADLINSKQDVLSAGAGISLDNNTISANLCYEEVDGPFDVPARAVLTSTGSTVFSRISSGSFTELLY